MYLYIMSFAEGVVPAIRMIYIRMIEMDVVDLIFGRLGVYLRHVLLHGALGHVAVLVGSP